MAEEKRAAPDIPLEEEDSGSRRRRYSDPHAKTDFAAKLNFWQQASTTTAASAAPHELGKESSTSDEKSGDKKARSFTPSAQRRVSSNNSVAAANASSKAALASTTSLLSPPAQIGPGMSVKERMKLFSNPPPPSYVTDVKVSAKDAPKSLVRLAQVVKAVEKGKPIAPDVKSAEPETPQAIPEESPIIPEEKPVNNLNENRSISEEVVEVSSRANSFDFSEKDTLSPFIGESNSSSLAASPRARSGPSSAIAEQAKLGALGPLVGNLYDTVHNDEDENKFSGTMAMKELRQSLPETDLEKQDVKRTLIRDEIVSTEKTYIAGLKILIEKFAHPLKASEKYGVSQDQAAQIFSNVEIIATFHDKLYEELQQPDKSVGEVFSKYADFLRMYTQYLNGYEQSMTVINTLSSNKQFKMFLESRRQDPEVHLDLMSYLILPVQRIPRYELLLRELIKNTPKEHSERETLDKAFTKIQAIAQHINEAKRRVENMSKVLAIQNKIEGNLGSNLLAPHRRLIKEGHLESQRTGLMGHSYRKRVFFLFNDSLLITAENYAFKDWILIDEESFALKSLEESSSSGKWGFEIQHKDHHEKYFLHSEAERDEWISVLNHTKEAYAEVIKAAKGRKDPSPSPRNLGVPSL